MKKRITLLCVAAACCLTWSSPVMAQDVPESASTELFDFEPFSDQKMLDLFYEAEQHGRKYPTKEEFEAAGFHLMDIEFVRSHTRPRS